VEFTVTRDKPGNYEADINGHKVYFTVKEGVSSSGSPVDARLIVIAVIAILVLTAIFLLVRRLAAR
jgi:hypothetical protein